MTNRQKRLLRVTLAAAGIAMAFTTVPVDAVAWVQTVGGWVAILVTAVYSNSDFSKKGGSI